MGLELHEPQRPGAARLIVAFRDRPTLEHFDPELVTFWRTGEDRRGHATDLTLESRTPVRAEFSWGRISLVDRLGIENVFATLGGELRMDQVRAGQAIAVFSSPGPILRLGGHSQDVDRVALELGAFFGRIMVPIDFDPGVEQAISAATPLERYAAFVAFEQGRYGAHAVLRQEQPATGSAFASEAHRLASEEPASWAAGIELLARMKLASAG